MKLPLFILCFLTGMQHLKAVPMIMIEVTISNCGTAKGNVLTKSLKDPRSFDAQSIGSLITAHQGKFLLQASGQFSYTPYPGFTGRDTIAWKLCETANGNCETRMICIEVLACGEVIAPEEFSPNGDGTDDTFVIEGIEEHQAHLQVYNRWGKLVYESTDYRNDWNATANGKRLPLEVYYYLLDLKDGKKARRGSVKLTK